MDIETEVKKLDTICKFTQGRKPTICVEATVWIEVDREYLESLMRGDETYSSKPISLKDVVYIMESSFIKTHPLHKMFDDWFISFQGAEINEVKNV